jgi:hypothetical protein
VTQNKDFRTLWHAEIRLKIRDAMQKTKSVSELLGGSSKALRELRLRLDERSQLLLQVRSALAPALVNHVDSAGLERGRLTLGTPSAAWASRLRYVTSDLRERLNADYQLAIDSVKIKIVSVKR